MGFQFKRFPFLGESEFFEEYFVNYTGVAQISGGPSRLGLPVFIVRFMESLLYEMKFQTFPESD